MIRAGTDALDNILKNNGGEATAQERIDAGDTGVPANSGKPIEWVPWLTAATPTHKSVEEWRHAQYTSPSQSDRAAEKIAALQGTAGNDPRLATEEEKAAGMLDPTTGFGLSDMAAREAAYQKMVSGNLPIAQDANKVYQAILQMDGVEFKDIASRMVKAGLIDEAYSRSDVVKVWGQLVGEAIDEHAANPTAMLTPVDMIELNHGNGDAAPKPDSVITKSVSISSNEQARSLLRQMMASQLGRRPTATEIDDFQASLNEAQRNNPTVNTSVSQLDRSGHTTNRSSTTTGGMDDSEFAYDAVTNTDPDSEYGKYQQATSYYNAFMQAIRGPGGSG